MDNTETSSEYQEMERQAAGEAGTPAQPAPESTVSPEQTASQPNNQQTPVWDGKQWSLKFRGREIVPDSREKLINWAQLGYSYDQRSEALKQQEEQIKSRAKQLEDYERLDQAFQQNPVFKQKILQLYNEHLLNQGQQGVEQGQEGYNGQDLSFIQPVIQQIQNLEKRLSTYESFQADNQLNSEVESLKSKYPNVDWVTKDEMGKTFLDEIMEQSYKMGGIPLEMAFRNSYWDIAIQNAKTEALKNSQNQQISNNMRGVVQNTPPRVSMTPSQKPINFANKSYDDIAKEVIAALPK
jgi:hypothetical protein